MGLDTGNVPKVTDFWDTLMLTLITHDVWNAAVPASS